MMSAMIAPGAALPARRAGTARRILTAAPAAPAAAVLLAAAACSSPPPPTPASILSGTWSGTYTCAQGLTALRLTVSAAQTGKLTATFRFSAVPSNPSVPTGSYTMTGTFTARAETLTPGRWLHQPAGYMLVGLHGGPPAHGGTVLTGKVTSSGCTTFSLKKKS
jgi:hypothetical protein